MKTSDWRNGCVVLAGAALLFACAPREHGAATQSASAGGTFLHPIVEPGTVDAQGRQFDSDGKPLDAAPGTTVFVQLEVWQLTLPYGKVSRNDDFWKRVDEQCVDVGTHDLLFKNGIRIGEAPTKEWDFFRKLIDDDPAISQKTVVGGMQASSLELMMAKNIEREDLFYFDADNVMAGRTFEHCVNLMSLSFQPAPRKLGTVRVAMVPTVRSQRKRLEFTARNEEKEIDFVAPERLYDCNLRADIGLNRFMIVAPSDAARNQTTIGRNFLVHDGQAEREETVLLFVPRSYTADAPAARDGQVDASPAGAR